MCGSGSSETYRGPSAFSAPEVARVRDFVNGRVVGGVQQIKSHIDWHTFSELILWPYGYTKDDTAATLSQDQLRLHLAARDGFERAHQALVRAGLVGGEESADGREGPAGSEHSPPVSLVASS